ncbi:hypothetical protein BLNAU_16951 [Blattamonas nauphoetae]|uniref:Uncharacterized protein n=1 Tax=Blattamonas nauphoetae TaxID=2049346 RepID=A0ABQ9X7X6_9EUKA|nr:hypothetical protein BLNAU_16951 [Blattamonas nauphoetae]
MSDALDPLFSTNQLSYSDVDAIVLLSADDGWSVSIGRPNTSAPALPLDQHFENHVLFRTRVCGIVSTEMADDELPTLCTSLNLDHVICSVAPFLNTITPLRELDENEWNEHAEISNTPSSESNVTNPAFPSKSTCWFLNDDDTIWMCCPFFASYSGTACINPHPSNDDDAIFTDKADSAGTTHNSNAASQFLKFDDLIVTERISLICLAGASSSASSFPNTGKYEMSLNEDDEISTVLVCVEHNIGVNDVACTFRNDDAFTRTEDPSVEQSTSGTSTVVDSMSKFVNPTVPPATIAIGDATTLSIHTHFTKSNDESDEIVTNESALFIDRVAFSNLCESLKTAKRQREAASG